MCYWDNQNLLPSYLDELAQEPSRDNIMNSQYEFTKDEFRFQIDHFSWRFVVFKRQDTTQEITMCCHPLVLKVMPPSRKVTARVHLYKAQKGMKEVN